MTSIVGPSANNPRHQERDSSYSDFLATHPPDFVDATGPLEADSWLRTTESKFGATSLYRVSKDSVHSVVA
jgi:hypothetical protein